MYDSHCHLQLSEYNNDRDEVIKRALNDGIKMICVGIDLETSKTAIEIAKKYKNIWAAIGIHPNEPDKKSDILELEGIIEHPKVAAIGEVGLDYYRISESNQREQQREKLARFLELSKKYKKPLIIHCREAYSDLLEIIDSKFKTGNGGTPIGVIHSFTSNWETAKKFIDRGFYIGFNGIITFTDQYNNTVKNTPLDKILTETDAPFLTPTPYRGKRNEPLWVKNVAERIAEIKNIPLEKVRTQTTINTELLFNLK